ncbi:carbohydrate ABC transporter permease [Martelella mediterranea]|uniref:Carbohydrate ABC transporter membrane protein 1 (CUT1 family) n=1 Tax=Martelella mediterranea TaxID=293089 RepID=A0A4R3NJ16_9HYPH|nr:sugar ABC transporter permease [Martelella mediterranea]TCT33069.1 carbohydrate ABC transporter membrane protein 1 (CUT1 family) [Martelella mediterranea]
MAASTSFNLGYWFAPENRSETIAGLCFVLPVVVGFAVFVAGPMIATFVMSFFYYDLLSPPEFAGLGNFAWALEDDRLAQVLKNTGFFAVFAVLGNVGLGVVLAVLLNRNLPAALRYVYRAAYFFPSLVGLIFVAVIWQFLFQRDIGIINYYLNKVGIGSVSWLSSPDMALYSVIILDVWKNVGFAMLIAMAGLQSISNEYYDAAKIDGAGALRTFWSVTIPLLSPTIFFLLTYTTIGAFKVFESIVVLTNGGPGDASRSMVMYIYETGFKSLEMGYASAISLILLAIIVALTAIQFILAKYWTFYE